MHHNAVLLFVLPGSLLMFCGAASADVTAERSERGVVIKIDGELFTEYLTKAGQSPAMWPVIGPTGKAMTRSYPVGPPQQNETNDHPHHQSLWFTHDQVNGVDFWKANVGAGSTERGARSRPIGLPAPSSPLPARPGPHIAHIEFDEVAGLGSTARIVARNDWMNGDKRVCEDDRTIVFGTRADNDRWIDFTITLKATDGDVTFGDTKEGTFAVRVADTMRVDAKLGGRIVNSEGQVNEDAWGMPAKWVDYTGPVDGQTVGIAILSHPQNFRPVPRWHVRTYGLFTANPFGERDFPKPELAIQGAFTIKRGDSMTLRYRMLLHRGNTDEADIAGAFEEFR